MQGIFNEFILTTRSLSKFLAILSLCSLLRTIDLLLLLASDYSGWTTAADLLVVLPCAALGCSIGFVESALSIPVLFSKVAYKSATIIEHLLTVASRVTFEPFAVIPTFASTVSVTTITMPFTVKEVALVPASIRVSLRAMTMVIVRPPLPIIISPVVECETTLSMLFIILPVSIVKIAVRILVLSKAVELLIVPLAIIEGLN